MSPQAPAAPAQQSATPLPKFPPDHDPKDPSQAFANQLLHQAHEIERERAEVMERQNANRTSLRLIDKQGLLSDAQGEYVDLFYPEKERGERRDRSDVDLTRRVREVARKGSASGNGGSES